MLHERCGRLERRSIKSTVRDLGSGTKTSTICAVEESCQSLKICQVGFSVSLVCCSSINWLKVGTHADNAGPQPYESSPSFTSWDTLFFTRDFKSINTDRSLRHVTKLLTYPITIGAVLHQNGPFTRGGEGRVTREGSRSFAGLYLLPL
jgi:hypothetical protein